MLSCMHFVSRLYYYLMSYRTQTIEPIFCVCFGYSLYYYFFFQIQTKAKQSKVNVCMLYTYAFLLVLLLFLFASVFFGYFVASTLSCA